LVIERLCRYDISVSDFIEDVRIDVVFKEDTEILKCNAVYSISDLKGFKSVLPQKHHLKLSLIHNLNSEIKAHVFIFTRRIRKTLKNIEQVLPKIQVKGRNRHGKIVYRYE